MKRTGKTIKVVLLVGLVVAWAIPAPASSASQKHAALLTLVCATDRDKPFIAAIADHPLLRAWKSGDDSSIGGYRPPLPHPKAAGHVLAREWNAQTALPAALLEFAPMLAEGTPMQPDPARVLAGSKKCKSPVSLLLKRRGCDACLIAVNMRPEKVKVEVDFGVLADWSEGEVQWENRRIALSGTKLVDAFGPFAVHVYRFRRPDVCYTAHQGEEALAPRHSRAAYRFAVEHGLDFIKLDIRQTKDENIVLQHDDNLLAAYGTNVVISTRTLAELRSFTCLPVGGFDKEKICTLEEALEFCNGVKRGPWIDFKDSSPKVIERTLEICRAVGFPEERILVGTWSGAALKYLRDHHPAVKRVQHTTISRVKGGFVTNASLKDADGTNPVFPDEDALIAGLLKYRENLGLYGFNLPHIVRKHRAVYMTTENVLRHVRAAGAWISIWFPEDEFTGELYRAFGAHNFVTRWADRTKRGFADDPIRAKEVPFGAIADDWPAE